MIPGIAILTLIAAWIRQTQSELSYEEMAGQIWFLWDLQVQRRSPLAPLDGISVEYPVNRLPPGWAWSRGRMGSGPYRPHRSLTVEGQRPDEWDILENLFAMMIRKHDVKEKIFVVYRTKEGDSDEFGVVEHPGWNKEMIRDLISWLASVYEKESSNEYDKAFMRHLSTIEESTNVLIPAMATLTALRLNDTWHSDEFFRMNNKEAHVFQDVYAWIHERLLRAELEP